MEQPGSLQSNPASIKILSKPSSSACFLTRPEPGTIIESTETFLPSTTLATSLKSSILPLVQEPINTLSILIFCISCLGSKPIYSRERSIALFLFGLLSSCGFGTIPSIATTSCGLVPQVICGEISSALIKISSSYFAPSSDGRDFQNSTALSQLSPDGA